MIAKPLHALEKPSLLCCVLPGLVFGLGEELEQLLGYVSSAGDAFSNESEVPLSPRALGGPACDVLAVVFQHKWQCGSSSAATCLEHSPLHGYTSAGMC